MAKKKYRIYKAGGAQQGRVMNPTAQFLAKAQAGMQQPSPEEMQMMEQQAMMQQQGQQQMQPQMQQQGNEDQIMQQLVAAIDQAMQNGAQPEEVVAKLLQDQVEPEMVAEALIELGMPMEEVDQLMASVIQQLQGGQGQPSEEEMMAMQQQQMAEQAPPQEQPMEEAPMSKGGYVKKRLKMAQEGMEQSGVKSSNTNLAAEDDVNNVSALIDFSKNNTLKNQYEQEYDEMQDNQGMMPEARLGREARQERRGIRQDARTERTAMRQADRSNRQAQRLAGRAVRQVTSPFGRVPGFSAYSPSPFMGGAMGDIELDVRERGLFGQLKSFKMNIDGMGFPARFSEGMFMNALYNPYGMPAGQSRIVRKLTTPGLVVDKDVVEKDEVIKFNQKKEAEGSDSSDNTLANKLLYNQLEAMKNRVSGLETGTGLNDDEVGDGDGLPDEVVPILVNSEDAKKKTNDDAVMWWVLGGLGTSLIVGDLLISRAQLKTATAMGAKTLEEAAAMEGTKATAEQVKAASKGPTFRERMRARVQSKPQMRNPLSGKFQAKPQTVRNYAKQKAANLARNTYKYTMKKPGAATASRFRKMASPVVRFLSRGKIKLEDGGYIDMMDQNYGNPDLYRFTGGGDYDYFADGGYTGYEDVTDPYMPYMQNGGYIPMAYDGYTVGEDNVTGTDQDTFNETYSSSVDDRFENPTQELYQSLSPEQREMYKAEYKRRQQAGYGQRGYGMQGYGMMGYGQPRRGLFNTVMGINAPGAIQRRQYLTQMAGPTYADGTPVIGGALPEGAQLKNIDVIKRGMFERMFPGKDEEGNRIARGPKRSIRYNFSTSGSTTPSLDGGDNAISNFKINPAPDVQPTPEPAGPAIDPGREGFNADSDGNAIPDYLQYENTAPGMREAEEMDNASVERMSLADDRVTPNLPVSKQQARKNKRVNNRKERKSNRDFRKIGRDAKRTYEGKNAPLTEEGKARMNQGYQYGGYQEGDEVYMSPEEVAQFMAAGGQIEFL